MYKTTRLTDHLLEPDEALLIAVSNKSATDGCGVGARLLLQYPKVHDIVFEAVFQHSVRRYFLLKPEEEEEEFCYHREEEQLFPTYIRHGTLLKLEKPTVFWQPPGYALLLFPTGGSFFRTDTLLQYLTVVELRGTF